MGLGATTSDSPIANSCEPTELAVADFGAKEPLIPELELDAAILRRAA